MKTEEEIREEIKKIDIILNVELENLNRCFDMSTALTVHNLKHSKLKLEWVLEE